VAEQLAKLIEELPDDPATFRTKLPSYLANAIDHATGMIPANEDGQVAPASVPGGAAA
jgi:hypothetical protein